MSGMATAVIGSAVVGGIASNNAAGKAADAASAGSDDAIAQQMLSTQQLEKMLRPYRQAGRLGLTGQLDLLGLSGAGAQANAISGLENSPMFTSLVKQGENALLQNASATGGLRGGNTAAALAEFRPQMLANVIENQYSKYAGLAGAGQNAAAGTGGFMQNSSGNISNLLSSQGIMKGQGIVAQGQSYADMLGGITKGIGMYQGQTQAPSINTGFGGYDI
jgi:hypothetical protein